MSTSQTSQTLRQTLLREANRRLTRAIEARRVYSTTR